MEQDEEYARRALRLLDEEPGWPSLVDIDRALSDGRRRERRRTKVRVGAATVAVGLVTGGLAGTVAHPQAMPPSGTATPDPSGVASVAEQAPPAPTTCAVRPLPVPEGNEGTMVRGGDPTGRYLVGISFDATGLTHPLLWTDGVPRVLEPKGTDAEIDGIAVNSSGTVAWSAGQSVFEYRDGKVNRVDAAEGFSVVRVDPANDIYVVDGGAPKTRPGTRPLRLLKVPAGSLGTARELERVDSLHAAVLAVDDDGTAVGLAGVGSAPMNYDNSYAAVWHDGTMTILMPADTGYAARPTATADGWIGGLSWPAASPAPNHMPDESGVAVRWNLRTGTAERIPGLRDVKDINRYGWTVGVAPDPRPVAVLGDHVLTLPLPAGADAKGSNAMTVSDDGQVIGGEAFLNGTATAVRWVCG